MLVDAVAALIVGKAYDNLKRKPERKPGNPRAGDYSADNRIAPPADAQR